MRLSASVAWGVGCVSVVQVSSFAFVQLGATPSGCSSCIAHSSQQKVSCILCPAVPLTGEHL